MPSTSSQLRCLIATGGTAGHVLPSLAVAEALTARGHAVSFAGPRRDESQPILEAGFEFDAYRAEGLPRQLSPKLARALVIGAVAPITCLRILRRRRPDVVLGGGGYAAGPMVFSAGLLRIPAAITEADAHLGFANRCTAPFARRVFLSFPIDGLEGAKYRVTGRPIPRRARVADAGKARRRFGLPDEGPVVLVFGGSQGARPLNRAALEAFAADGPSVLHLTGERDYPELAGQPQREDYRMLAFTDDFGGALAAADLVVARAGGSVWEVAAAGKPAILVPYPYATADHQRKNAEYFVKGGGAVVVPEPRLDLRREVEALLRDPERLADMSRAMAVLARPEAAEEIAEELVALASA